MAWLTNWNRRKLITVNGSTSGALSDYQMKLIVNQASGTDSSGIVNLGGNVLTTFNDLRFTKSDGTTALNYWIESITGSSPNLIATVWIKLAPSPDTIPANPGTYNFYIYYNNTGATSLSSGVDTFRLFDDFADNKYTGRTVLGYPTWTPISGNWDASSGRLTNTNIGGGGYYYIQTDSTSVNAEWKYKTQLTSATNYEEFYMNFMYVDVNNRYTLYNGNNNDAELGKTVAGVFTRLYYISSGLGTGTAVNEWIIRRTSSGSIEVLLNGVSKITVSDNSITSSNKIVVGGKTDHGNNYFDDFRIRKYVSPEPTFSTIGIEELSITAPAAIGGTVTSTATNRIHTFTSSGTFTANKSMNVEVLVIGGGGSGGVRYGGGGGAGGYVYNSAYAVTAQTYPVTIGNGGISQTATMGDGYIGQNSVFGTLTSYGGGFGGGADHRPGGNGGCGGGGCGFAGGGIGSQGGNGGLGGGQWSGGGGGGASTNGSVAPSGSVGGAGGAGTVNSISGSPITYAGGGGGAAYNATGGAGGTGGGGAGGMTAYPGTVNTGGGGGAKGGDAGGSGAGGSGIVIISYPLSEDITPANITATLMTITPSENPCRIGICTVTVSVTWTNNGGSEGSFVPNITIGNNPITPIYPLQSLAKDASVTKEFVITDLPAGSHPICPDPN